MIKHLYFSVMVCLMVLWISPEANSQTIIKTVGATGADYPNLRTAFAAVNDKILTGNIEFQIISSVTDNNEAKLYGAGQVGEVTTVVDVTSGSGYVVGDLVTFSAPDDPTGTTASGRVSALWGGTPSGRISQIEITNPGSGYTSEPTVSVVSASGSGANPTVLLGGSYSGISIYPTVSGAVLSGSGQFPIINLLGADNVVIDGRVNRQGTVADMTIENRNPTSSSTVITLTNKSENITIKFSKLLGNRSERISIRASTNGMGSSSVIVEDNFISTLSGAPTDIRAGIYIVGNSSNTNITIRNNEFVNLLASSVSIILANENPSNIIIEGNHFYQTEELSLSPNPRSVIRLNSGSNNTIKNNYIGGSARFAGGTPWKHSSSGNSFCGILINDGSGFTIDGNTITNFSMSMTSGSFTGLETSALASNLTIGTTTPNMFGSLDGSSSIICNNCGVRGILTRSANTTIANNVLGGFEATSISGILRISGTGNVSGNTLGNFKRTNTLTSDLLLGIESRPVSGADVVNNHIYNLVNESSFTTVGINAYGGTVANNIISLNPSATAETRGISKTNSGSLNLYHNTVVIEGLVGSGSKNTFAVFDNRTDTRNYRNNIFVNNVSNQDDATGKHYAISLSSAPGDIDFNNYYASGTGGVLGVLNGADKTSLSEWKSATLKDCFSISIDPDFTGNAGIGVLKWLPKETSLVASSSPVTVLKDFLQVDRDAFHPAMGALEFQVNASEGVFAITSFTPASGTAGVTVTITGIGFTGASAVKFNGINATSFTVTSDTEITAVVPSGNFAGRISITLPCGTIISETNFDLSLAPLAPTITSFSPLKAKPGDAVTITGTGFNATAANNIVFFGATRASVTTATATSLTVTVPTGATFAPIILLNGGNALAAYSLQNFHPIYSPSKTGITSADFSPKQDFTTHSAAGQWQVAIGDLDGDGKPDLAVANRTTNMVSIFRNTSTSGSITSGSFAEKVDFATGSTPISVAIGDLDGDGKPDLAVTNQTVNTVSVFRNTSTSGSITASSFAAKVDFPAGTGPFSVAIGDLDGDGKLDLAVANSGTNTVSVFQNTSSSGSMNASSFAAKVDFTAGSAPYSIAIGDLDGDGKPDLAVANHSSANVSVLRNTSTLGSITSDSFAANQNFATGINPLSVAIGDLDGDGKPDLSVANYGSNNISVLRNTSSSGSITSGSFAGKQDFASGPNSFSVAIGDLDGDGKPDLASTNAGSNTVSLFRNTSSSGSITLANKQDFATGSMPFSIAIGDLDGDGKPDLAVGNHLSSTVSVLRQAELSNNADLSAFEISAGTLDPTFASATTSYTASVGNAITSITVTPTRSDANATITVNGVAVSSGTASGAIALAVGSNTISTVVTAQDGNTTKTYTLTITRAAITEPSAPTNLSATARDTEIEISFTAGSNGGSPITNYEYSLNDDSDWVAFNPSVTSSPVTITGLTNRIQYTIKLRAVNAAGNGVASETVTATPLSNNLILVFNTALAPGNTVKVPLYGTVNVEVDWGDGGPKQIYTSIGERQKTYSAEGIYTVTIRGLANTGTSLSTFGDVNAKNPMLTRVESFGNLGLTSLQYAFFGATNLTEVPATLPATVTSLLGTFSGATIFNQDLSGWDVTNVTTMSSLFSGATLFNGDIRNWKVDNVTSMANMLRDTRNFNQDISGWNVGKVTQMNSMFNAALAFNQNIGNWDVSKVTTMAFMFQDAPVFNQDIGNWNVGNVTDMRNLFRSAIAFNQDIGNWDVSKVTNMTSMFQDALVFNRDISNWNVSNVTNMTSMFQDAKVFNQDIGNWNVSKVTNMLQMFFGARDFNHNLNLWNVGNVTDMRFMFASTQNFNGDIGDWDVSKVTRMGSMFGFARVFNQDIGRWNVGNVTDFAAMFQNANEFNQDIGNWNVSKATSLRTMFGFTDKFNQDIGDWNVSNVTDLGNMFYGAKAFNQDIGNWNVSNVTDMSGMFLISSAFNKNISGWDVRKVTNMSSMFFGANAFNQSLGSWILNGGVNLGGMLTNNGMDCASYSATLIGWAANNPTVTGRSLGATSRKYGTDAVAARNTLISRNWTITDGGSSGVRCGPVVAPSAPTSLSATAGNGKIEISFTAGDDGGSEITNYEYTLNDGENWTAFDPADTASPVTITGLTNGTEYTIKLRAVNEVGKGTESASISSTPKTTPSAPTSLLATAGNSEIEILFTAGNDGGSSITNYEYTLNDGEDWTAFDPAVTASPVTINGLDNGTEYTIKLRAVNAVGKGAESASISSTPKTTPSAPTSLSATAGNGKIEISFTAGDDGGSAITNYEYTLDNGDNWYPIVPSVTASPVTITCLTNGNEYTIKLRAVNEVGKGAISESITSTPKTTPSAPRSLSATAGNGEIEISFTAGNDGGSAITNYEYTLNDGEDWTAFNPAVTASPVTITGLTNGTDYTIKLRSVNAVGKGAESASISSTPKTTPSAPTSLSATAGNDEIEISFTAGNDGGSAITNYEYTLNDGDDWIAFDPEVTASPVTINGLDNGTEYTIKLRAVNAVGKGAESESIKETTLYPDSDGDGVPDYFELLDDTDPENPKDYKDSDEDGVPDYIENIDGTNPLNANQFKDSDGGGTPDYVEEVLFSNYGLEPTDIHNPLDDDQDTDRDGLSDYEEILLGTNPLVPNCELENAIYSGVHFVSTTTIKSTEATVQLAASIQLKEGKMLSNQKVRFVNLDLPQPDRKDPEFNNNPYFLTNWLIPQAIFGLNGQGSVSAQVSMNIGNLDSQQFRIGIYEERCGLVGEDAIVTVSKPLDDFVTGGGYIKAQQAGGKFAAEIGSKIHFGFNVKFNKRNTNLQGNTSIVFRKNEKTYLIKANNFSSLSAVNATSRSPAHATYSARANVFDITDPNQQITVASQRTLNVVMTDRNNANGGEKSMDDISFTLWDNDGSLLFSSNWNQGRTVEQILNRGNIQINRTTSSTGKVSNKLTLTSDAINNISIEGNAITFTVTVVEEDSATPSGTVTFLSGDMILGYVPLVGNKVSFKTNILAEGTHDIWAYYNGDSRFSSSSTQESGILHHHTVIKKSINDSPQEEPKQDPSKGSKPGKTNGGNIRTIGSELEGLQENVKSHFIQEFQDAAPYPNPGNGLYQINLSGYESGLVEIRVTDSNGKSVRVENTTVKDNRIKFQLDIQSEAAGIYFCYVKQGFDLRVFKLIKR